MKTRDHFLLKAPVMPLAPPRAAALALLFGLAAAPAHAAESYANCTGYIDSLPTTIGAEGTWCLRKNLITGISAGQAISVNANNVTLDCNDFQIAGTAPPAGGNTARAILGSRNNTTVRNCAISNFSEGVKLAGAGHLVVDNRIDRSHYTGVVVEGEATVRRNRVLDTGGGLGAAVAILAVGTVDVIDNTIAGVAPAAPNSSAYGIRLARNDGGSVTGNRIRDLIPTGYGNSVGISVVDPSWYTEGALVTWAEAKAQCESHGMQLATITSAAEAARFADVPFTYGSLWIGGTRLPFQSTWTWVDGTAFVWENWTDGMAHVATPDTRHAVLNEDGGWAVDVGSHAKPFVCEFPDGAPVAIRRNVIVGSGLFVGSQGISGSHCRALGNQIVNVTHTQECEVE